MSILNQSQLDKSIEDIVENPRLPFAIVAVRCNSEDSTGKRKLMANEIYYLLDGFDVQKGNSFITSERHIVNSIYDDYLFSLSHGSKEKMPHIQISAVVGQNGSGKSSLIEFMIRLINNAAAIAFSKDDLDYHPLKYINGVRGDLWYVENNQLWRLSVCDSQVAIFDYYSESLSIIRPNGTNIFLRDSIGRLFYTIVSNYSLYAFNSKDFVHENQIRDSHSDSEYSKRKIKLFAEDNCWISKLFHKTDGYQIPLVLTPLRKEGNIDINLENELARERLITLLINNDNFRLINGHLRAESITISLPLNKEYGLEAIKEKLKIENLKISEYSHLSMLIRHMWAKKISENLPAENPNIPYYNIAIQYLVYKTLKIAKRYYNVDLENLVSRINNGDSLTNEFLWEICDNYTHVTRKIYQTLSYIIYHIYSFDTDKNQVQKTLKFEDIKESRDKIKELGYAKDWTLPSELTCLYHQSIIPPPFFDSTINLHEDEDSNIKIDFDSLSSGEKQQIYSVSSLLYHLDNLDSVTDDEHWDNKLFYPHVFLVLEEIELYFHPEMQQQYIKLLLDGIQQSNFKNIKGIHILLVTHSPFILSDIPSQNILVLNKNGVPVDKKKVFIKSFGANIHEILRHPFFLSDGAVGAFAKQFISQLGNELEKVDKYTQKSTLTSIKKKIELIDEPIVYRIFMDEYKRRVGASELIDDIDRQIEELQRKRAEIEASGEI